MLPPQSGIVAESKYRPLEPVSIKLLVRLCAPSRVVKCPVEGSVVRTVPDVNWLFDCVPMPKISDPLKVATPGELTAGKSITTPLLSDANRGTGFFTC